MSSVDPIVDFAEEQCSTHGTRLTPKRKRVLSALLQSDRALSAYELIDVCKDRYGDTLQAASMYRILDFLNKEQLVHKLSLANQYVACSHITCDHDCTVSQFLICNKCKKVKEIGVASSTVDEFQSAINRAGFQLASTQFEINCICDSCASESS